ncbi:hypothetical protein [Actinacidiphila sp. ITFR-21]|uniref:hypothetical protein n=1 Tax=Actinacidiphila sp. ITFR-21 TaxID=3075199 RepID=UPI00288A814B|nr:hypothetical protein [Streptomyces sp. ITFR-21]WNI14343.1 hypothetical protein RLT57_01530 [Streptomyces sp. ITFR-21]
MDSSANARQSNIESPPVPRPGHLVPECAADEQCCAQVWLRPEGAHQLEYRGCGSTERSWTRTASAARVVAALRGWAAGKTAWRESFREASQASWFTGPTA